MKNKIKYVGFLIIKVQQILKRFDWIKTLAKNSYFWGVNLSLKNMQLALHFEQFQKKYLQNCDNKYLVSKSKQTKFNLKS